MRCCWEGERNARGWVLPANAAGAEKGRRARSIREKRKAVLVKKGTAEVARSAKKISFQPGP